MSKFKPGVRVVVIDENNELKKGVIKSIFESVNIAIVEFDDDTIGKVNITNLGICREEPTEEPTEPEKKIRTLDKNTEVTITLGDFADLCIKTAVEMGRGSIIDMLKLSNYGAKLTSELFSDVEND